MSSKQFNLTWHQNDSYWITIYAKEGSFAAPLKAALQKIGLEAVAGNTMTIQTDANWKAVWDSLYAALQEAHALTSVEANITPGAAAPNGTTERKTTAAIQVLAESLWLGEALSENRILCYLQPVMSGKDKIFGYESFARAKTSDGGIIGGDKIMAASRALNIEYMIDRHLHVQAIRTFMSSEFNGFLFVNFFPGFIHRPAVYLEGLSETAKNYGIVSKHIVLDFTRSETPRDLSHLKSVCEYGRSRGYSIALDDIESLENVTKLMPEIRPDFVKIDMQLVRSINDPEKYEVVRQIVDFVHSSGGMVIGEGVETEEAYTKLKQLGVDLFQGYYFAPPAPVEVALKPTTATG